MNLRPLLGFFWKHGSQLQNLMESGAKPDGHLLIDVAAALTPVVKKHWPVLNENGLIDDGLSVMREVLAADSTISLPPEIDRAQGVR